MIALERILDIFLLFYAYFYASLFITSYSFIFSFKGISNISAPTGFFIFILTSRYLVNRRNFSNTPLIKIIGNLKDKQILSIAFLFLLFWLFALSMARHFSFSSGTHDLGIFDQAIWNASQGNSLFCSLKNNVNLMGDHFEPILFLIAPLYKLWPNVAILFILQSLLVSSAIVPLYLIAKQKISYRLLLFSFIVSYVLSRAVRGVGLSDFHPDAFILPSLFWAYYFLKNKNNLLFFAALALASLCKEDVTLLVSGFGIFLYFTEKRRKLGVFLFFLGICLWIIETKLVIPYFNPLAGYHYTDRLPFGPSYIGNIKTVIYNPASLIRIFFSQEKIEYCLKLFAPLGFLFLLSPAHYVLIGSRVLSDKDVFLKVKLYRKFIGTVLNSFVHTLLFK